jgi:hypothetical protein
MPCLEMVLVMGPVMDSHEFLNASSGVMPCPVLARHYMFSAAAISYVMLYAHMQARCSIEDARMKHWCINLPGSYE